MRGVRVQPRAQRPPQPRLCLFQYLDRIGQLFFGVPPKQTSSYGGLLGEGLVGRGAHSGGLWVRPRAWCAGRGSRAGRGLERGLVPAGGLRAPSCFPLRVPQAELVRPPMNNCPLGSLSVGHRIEARFLFVVKYTLHTIPHLNGA